MVLHGDCLQQLKTLPDASVQCCVTSPPYWGLRDYGVDGQIGLESTPDAYVQKMVAVFREVRRVLKDDGTCWLNLGDSYASTPPGNSTKGVSGKSTLNGVNGHSGHYRDTLAQSVQMKRSTIVDGLKPKDLVGIPWRVAFALQQPYYTGRIKRLEDRVWLAAMLDAEGCMFIHKRKAGQNNGQGYARINDTYGPGLEISNTHRSVVERCMEIAQVGSICYQDGGRRQRLFRWNVRLVESRELVRELYPHLVAKQHQARIFCGCPSSGPDAEAAHGALIALHRGSATDIDAKPPRSMFEPGWYLRSDIIWAKLNPMPESVTDRPTKSHEYIFLLTKSERYFYDHEAIKEDADISNFRDAPCARRDTPPGQQADTGFLNGRYYTSRNKRTVWTIATQPYPEAHFATFPPKLIEPCILAGSRPGDVVMDPFAGSGTTLYVAKELGRQFIGIELNPAYVKLIDKRLIQEVLF